jgi:type IV secretion system protein VirB4
MFLFLKKKTEDENRGAAVVSESIPLHEFIPYHSHYNAHTLLTKNGELMQIIRIATNNQGLRYESGASTNNTVRDTVRRTISESFQSDKFSLWIHTLRKRSNISHRAQYKEPFAAYVHEHWQKKHHWKYQYYNEIYITILHDGQQAELFDKTTLRHVFLPKRNRRYRNAYLDEAYKELDTLVTDVLQKIRQHYNAHRLSIIERSTGTVSKYYSEPMEFLGTLLNLRTDTYPLTECDISQAIATNTLTFGFNAVEAKNSEGQRRFGGLLTLKQYREMPPETVDRVLQAPVELIVSQSFNFTPPEKALEPYKVQKELFDISGDAYSIQATGITEMLRNNRERPVDFGEHQTSMMVLVDEYKLLDNEVNKTQAAFADLGLIAIREDIRLEEGFWAQFPGNFEFIRRKDVIGTERVAGFCRLNRFPNGTAGNNHWGDAVTLLPTMVNSPYFFNFHVQDNGHTVLFDFNSFHDHMSDVLLNLMVTLMLKYQGKTFLFDRKQSARLFFNKLDATYHQFSGLVDRKKPHKLHLNPFALEPDKHNTSFLLAWCMTLLEPAMTLSEEHRETLREAIDQLYAAPQEQRHLPALVAQLATQDTALSQAMGEFVGSGRFAGLFDAHEETFDVTDALQAFDMDPAIATGVCALPLFSYLLHRIITSLNGQPTVIVVHEACDLLENPFFAPRLESLLEMLKQNNVMLLVTTKSPQEDIGSQTFATLMKSCATRLYLPDDINLNYEAQGVGLTAHDARLLSRMERQRGDFLLKQSKESIALRANFDDMDDVKAIYANDIKNLIAAGGKFASLPQDD